MSNLVIVAIPDENDRVWKVSSEKVPHLTLLFLGESSEVSNLAQIVQFVEHAASTTLKRFYLPVDRRDALGEDQADTLIFKKGRYDYKAVRDFRVQLLKDNNIRTAYDKAAQHEGPWLPHLTLGYPDTPAKPDDTDRDFGFYDVSFNKIAVWDSDYEGPDFLLKDMWDEWETMETAPMDVAWSDVAEAGSEFMLEHYGVKGMRWGQRKDETRKGWLDPEGHDMGTDVARTAIGLLLPVVYPLTIPSNIRLARAAGRNIQTAAKQNKTQKEDRKFEKVAKSQEGFLAIHNGSIEHTNRAIGSINKKYPDLSKPATKKKYDDEVLKAMQDAYRDSANRIGNKRGDKHLDVEFKNDGMDFSIKVKDGPQKPTVERVKHAAVVDDDGVTFKGKIKRNDTAHIVGFEFEDFEPEAVDSLAQQAIETGAEYLVHKGLMDPEHFLEHYGVKGMHWGTRRARDVPPTPVAPTATSRVPHGNRRKTKIQVEGGQNHDAHPDAVKVAEAKAKLKKSGTAALSNKELQDMAKRLQLEGQVKQLTSPAGQKFVTNFLKSQGQQTAQGVVQKKVKKQFAY